MVNGFEVQYPVRHNWDIANMHASFVLPFGPDEEYHPYITDSGRILPGEIVSHQELEGLIDIARTGKMPIWCEEVKHLPSLKQLSRISIGRNTGCWELPIYGDGNDVYPPGSENAGQPRARYGNLQVKGVQAEGSRVAKPSAHRTMYLIFNGYSALSDGQHLDHLCNNKRCCWPRHLEAVTPSENSRRGLVNGRAKLPEGWGRLIELPNVGVSV